MCDEITTAQTLSEKRTGFGSAITAMRHNSLCS
jgi:hypothetical protein